MRQNRRKFNLQWMFADEEDYHCLYRMKGSMLQPHHHHHYAPPYRMPKYCGIVLWYRFNSFAEGLCNLNNSLVNLFTSLSSIKLNLGWWKQWRYEGYCRSFKIFKSREERWKDMKICSRRRKKKRQWVAYRARVHGFVKLEVFIVKFSSCYP